MIYVKSRDTSLLKRSIRHSKNFAAENRKIVLSRMFAILTRSTFKSRFRGIRTMHTNRSLRSLPLEFFVSEKKVRSPSIFSFIGWSTRTVYALTIFYSMTMLVHARTRACLANKGLVKEQAEREKRVEVGFVDIYNLSNCRSAQWTVYFPSRFSTTEFGSSFSSLTSSLVVGRCLRRRLSGGSTFCFTVLYLSVVLVT